MDLRGWFKDSFTVQTRSGASDAGDAAWGAQRPIKGRVEIKKRRVQGVGGTIDANVSVLCTDQKILSGDRLWLAGQDLTDENAAQELGMVRSAGTKTGGFTLYEVDLV